MSAADEEAAIDSYIEDGTDWPDDVDLAPLDIDSRKQASKELFRLAKLDREATQVQAIYDARRVPLDAYLSDRLGGIERKRLWLRRGLELFMRAVFERDRVKSLALPDGTLSLEKPRQRVEGDPDLVPEDWRPFLVTWKPSLAKSEVHKRLTPGGVIGDEGADGTVRRFALDAEGTPVAGVWFVTDDEDKFNVKLTQPDEGE